MKPEWFTEDGTFIGPWWTRWAWFFAFLAGIAYQISDGVIEFDSLLAWSMLFVLLNWLRAKEAYLPIVRFFK